MNYKELLEKRNELQKEIDEVSSQMEQELQANAIKRADAVEELATGLFGLINFDLVMPPIENPYFSGDGDELIGGYRTIYSSISTAILREESLSFSSLESAIESYDRAIALTLYIHTKHPGVPELLKTFKENR